MRVSTGALGKMQNVAVRILTPLSSYRCAQPPSTKIIMLSFLAGLTWGYIGVTIMLCYWLPTDTSLQTQRNMDRSYC